MAKRPTQLRHVHPDKKNARTHNERNLSALEQSLKQFGAGRSIVIDERGRILAGNGITEAARRVGIKNVRVIEADGKSIIAIRRTGLTETQKVGLALADNRTSELAGWNEKVLEELSRQVDLTQVGFTEEELRTMFNPAPPAEEGPPARLDQAEALRRRYSVKKGQLWEAGPHRLYVGDCTDPDSWTALMRGTRAAMCFTDPPWNVAIGGDSNPRHRQRELLQNDKMTTEAFQAFISGFATQLATWCEGDVYCILATREWPTLDRCLRGAGFHWSATVIWVKDIFVLGSSKYHRRYEPIWYGWHTKGKSSFCGGRRLDDVWEIPRPRNSEEHPTMKPVPLVARAILNSSRKAGLVLDPFLGSGTTAVAAQESGRVFAGMDIEPKYVAVALDRLQQMGLEPRLVEEV